MRLKKRVCESDGDEMLCWGFHGQGLRFEDLLPRERGKKMV